MIAAVPGLMNKRHEPLRLSMDNLSLVSGTECSINCLIHVFQQVLANTDTWRSAMTSSTTVLASVCATIAVVVDW